MENSYKVGDTTEWLDLSHSKEEDHIIKSCWRNAFVIFARVQRVVTSEPSKQPVTWRKDKSAYRHHYTAQVIEVLDEN